MEHCISTRVDVAAECFQSLPSAFGKFHHKHPSSTTLISAASTIAPHVCGLHLGRRSTTDRQKRPSFRTQHPSIPFYIWTRIELQRKEVCSAGALLRLYSLYPFTAMKFFRRRNKPSKASEVEDTSTNTNGVAAAGKRRSKSSKLSKRAFLTTRSSKAEGPDASQIKAPRQQGEDTTGKDGTTLNGSLSKQGGSRDQGEKLRENGRIHTAADADQDLTQTPPRLRQQRHHHHDQHQISDVTNHPDQYHYEHCQRGERLHGSNEGNAEHYVSYLPEEEDFQHGPTMEMVPSLLHDIQNSTITSHPKPARALRYLFDLSEQTTEEVADVPSEASSSSPPTRHSQPASLGGINNNGARQSQHQHQHHSSKVCARRLELVQRTPKLIPTLFQFLVKCPSKSSQQYLVLLVLNNLSIPAENKRIVAITFGGAKLFARLLCQDPSCHLIAIILVNLTFSDADLRYDLVRDRHDHPSGRFDTERGNSTSSSQGHGVISESSEKHRRNGKSAQRPNQANQLLPALSYCALVSSMTTDDLSQYPVLQRVVLRNSVSSTEPNGHAAPTNKLVPPTRLTYDGKSLEAIPIEGDGIEALDQLDLQMQSQAQSQVPAQQSPLRTSVNAPKKYLKLYLQCVSTSALRHPNSSDRGMRTNEVGAEWATRSLSSATCNFPDSVRWCLVAVKHATQPAAGSEASLNSIGNDDSTACSQLMRCGMIPLLLRWITIATSGHSGPSGSGAHVQLTPHGLAGTIRGATHMDRGLLSPDRKTREDTSRGNDDDDDDVADDIRLLRPSFTPTQSQRKGFEDSTPDTQSTAMSSVTPLPTTPLVDDLTVFSFDTSTSIHHAPSLQQTTSRNGNDGIQYFNTPTEWDNGNSIQDSALFIIMNLSLCESTRPELIRCNAVNVLSYITQYATKATGANTFPLTDASEASKTKRQQIAKCEWQGMKAKMALAYLIGSEGHFGQREASSARAVHNAKSKSRYFQESLDHPSLLAMTTREVDSLVELLANSLQNRAKKGPGGYLASTFNAKYVLFAIRCLLTQTSNQLKIAGMDQRGATNVGGDASRMARLNCLLMKVLAHHSVPRSASLKAKRMHRARSGVSISSSSVSSSTSSGSLNVAIDSEAAEYAVFSMYLLSSHGFKSAFLPSMFSSTEHQNCLAAKVLMSYLHTPFITDAGRHAAEQLLLRLRHLAFHWSIHDVALHKGRVPSTSDLTFGGGLLGDIGRIRVEKRLDGAEPSGNIFNRRVIRLRRSRSTAAEVDHDAANANSIPSGTMYVSALHAAQGFSFRSSKSEASSRDSIDDVDTANRIAASASGTIGGGAFGYEWRWYEDDGDSAGNVSEKDSADSRSSARLKTEAATNPISSMKSMLLSQFGNLAEIKQQNNEPLSFLGFRCGWPSDQVE